MLVVAITSIIFVQHASTNHKSGHGLASVHTIQSPIISVTTVIDSSDIGPPVVSDTYQHKPWLSTKVSPTSNPGRDPVTNS